MWQVHSELLFFIHSLWMNSKTLFCCVCGQVRLLCLINCFSQKKYTVTFNCCITYKRPSWRYKRGWQSFCTESISICVKQGIWLKSTARLTPDEPPTKRTPWIHIAKLISFTIVWDTTCSCRNNTGNAIFFKFSLLLLLLNDFPFHLCFVQSGIFWCFCMHPGIWK